MDEKTLKSNLTKNKKKNYTAYSATRTLCRRFARSVFGANRRYC